MIKNLFAFTVLLFIVNTAEAGRFRVAVIDDGISLEMQSLLSDNLCKNGGYDFVSSTENITGSTHGHGDDVVYQLIESANTKNFCIMVYRISAILDIAKAIERATDDGATLINMSMFSVTYYRELEAAVINAEKNKVTIFAAAGNEKQNLNEVCNLYPQCLKRKNVFVVGATDPENKLEDYSNYGTNVVKMYKYGRTNSGARGTSFASPRAMGEYIYSLNLDKRK